MAFYLKLAETHLGARRRGGGMFAGGFRMMTGPSLDAMRFHASDDESTFDPLDTVVNPGGGTMRVASQIGHRRRRLLHGGRLPDHIG